MGAEGDRGHWAGQSADPMTQGSVHGLGSRKRPLSSSVTFDEAELIHMAAYAPRPRISYEDDPHEEHGRGAFCMEGIPGASAAARAAAAAGAAGVTGAKRSCAAPGPEAGGAVGLTAGAGRSPAGVITSEPGTAPGGDGCSQEAGAAVEAGEPIMSNSSTCDVLMLEAPLGPLQRASLAAGGATATAASPPLTAGLVKPSGHGGAEPPAAAGEGKQAAAAVGAAAPVSASRSEDSTSQSIMHTGGTRRAVSPGGPTRARPHAVSNMLVEPALLSCITELIKPIDRGGIAPAPDDHTSRSAFEYALERCTRLLHTSGT